MSLPEVPNAEKVSEVAEEVGNSASDLEEVVTSVSAEWGKLPAVYEAPEAEVVYSALSSLPDREERVSDATRAIKRALDDYASTLKTLEADKASLKELQTSLNNDDLPEGLVRAEQTELNTSISQLHTRVAEADEDCAQQIRTISGVGKEPGDYVALIQSPVLAGTYLKYFQDSGSKYAQVQLVDTYATIIIDEGIQGELDEETLEQFNEILEEALKDGETSSLVLDRLGGERLVALTSAAASAVKWGPVGGQTMADNLTKLLGRGDRWNEKNGKRRQSEELAQEMVAYLDPVSGGRYSLSSPNDIYALSYLLKDNTLSTPFLLEMGNELEAMEQGFEEWETWDYYTTLGTDGGPLLFGIEQRGAAADPLASYMSALGNNGEASLDFFAPYNSERAAARQEYWIKDRAWAHDQFDGILSALDAAVTDEANVGTRRAGGLMSTTVEYLSDAERGKDRSNTGFYHFEDRERIGPDSLSPQASEHMAHMFNTYMEAVDYYASNNKTPDGSLAGETAAFPRAGLSDAKNMPIFEKSNLSTLVQATVSHDEGLVALRQGVTNFEDLRMGTVIQENHENDDFEKTLNLVAGYDANLESFFVESIGNALIDEGKTNDARIEAWVQLGNDTYSALPIKSLPGGAFIDILGKQIVSAGSDSLLEKLATYEAEAVDNANEIADESLFRRQHAIVAALYDNDVISFEDVQEVAQSENLTTAELEAFFEHGYPDFNTVDDNHGLIILSNTLAEEHLELNSYKNTYHTGIRKYFE